MRKIYCAILLFISTFSLHSQVNRHGLYGSYYNNPGTLTFSYGPSYCLADTYSSLFNKNFWNGTNYQVSIGYLQKLGIDNFSYHIRLNYMNFSGEDKDTKYHHSKLTSKSIFESYISDVAQLTVCTEYAIKLGEGYGKYEVPEIYLFGGVGALISYARFPNTGKIATYPGKTTASPSVVMPMGMGYRLFISDTGSKSVDDHLFIGFEAQAQIVFSDLIDGYEGSHITGVRIVNDNLGSFSLTMGYKF